MSLSRLSSRILPGKSAGMSLAAIVFAAAIGLAAFKLIAAGPADDSAELRKGPDAMAGWAADAPGVRRVITVADLPAPYLTPSAREIAVIVHRPADALPKVSPGFEVDLLADGLNNPRKIITAPNGDLFVAESGPNRVSVLHPGPDGKIAS
jgi:glucose/arabinose dehydrogenase